MLHPARRIMKHACRRMKRSLDRLHVFLPWNQGKKNGGENFIVSHHSETHFELKNSEFRREINFWKSLHFYSEKKQKETEWRYYERRKLFIDLKSFAYPEPGLWYFVCTVWTNLCSEYDVDTKNNCWNIFYENSRNVVCIIIASIWFIVWQIGALLWCVNRYSLLILNIR